MKIRRLQIIVFWLIAVLFVWFVWPTPYVTVSRGRMVSHYNRFTGAECDITESCWWPESTPSVQPAPASVPHSSTPKNIFDELRHLKEGSQQQPK